MLIQDGKVIRVCFDSGRSNGDYLVGVRTGLLNLELNRSYSKLITKYLELKTYFVDNLHTYNFIR